MAVVPRSTTFTPGLDFNGEIYSGRSNLFDANMERGRAILEEKLPVRQEFRTNYEII
jgi:hypothetical protein